MAKLDSTGLAVMNRECLCVPITRADIDAHIVDSHTIEGLGDLLKAKEVLFAGTAVFISASDLRAMQAQIKAIEAAAALPAFKEQALGRYDHPSLHTQEGTRSVLMGYDFHVSADGPKLIEVNTNAGGAFLVSAMEEALLVPGLGCGHNSLAARATGNPMADMFIAEWQAAGRNGKPGTIAIVDEDPEDQYLYLDMLLAKAMLEKAGLGVLIVDPKDLTFSDGLLKARGRVIDFVYNRLTDFTLTDPAHIAILQALTADAAVISPAPRHHALLANKKNLGLLNDAEKLQDWGLAAKHVAALSSVPLTRLVSQLDPEELWAKRKQYFFKPAAGFGSRAAYRGDKITKRVWADILAGDYVAQALVPPPVRGLSIDGEPTSLKFDVRVYTYAGEALLYAARVYQGQTTNFRTKGGGFAPVIPTST